MFVKLSEQARECRLYADHCAAKAGLQTEPKLRQVYLHMQQRWLSITVVIFCWHILLISESMDHHDSEIMDDRSID